MKSGRYLSVLLILLMLTAGWLFADEKALRMESRIMETWDGQDSSFFIDTGEPIAWQAQGSKFTAEELPLTTYVLNEWPDELFGRSPENPEELGILGIKGAFVRQGYNQLELIPGVGEGDSFVAKPLPFPGRVHMLDFWVWGSNYDYYVELHFIDNSGIAHVLSPVREELKREPGSIKFIGWKNLFVVMPNYIKNAINHKPTEASISLTKIVFTTHPAERVSDFYIYVDHLKVLADLQQSFYDGFQLSDPVRIEEIWGSGE